MQKLGNRGERGVDKLKRPALKISVQKGKRDSKEGEKDQSFIRKRGA